MKELLQPFTLNTLELRNRIVTPSDELYYDLKDQSKNLDQLNNSALANGGTPFSDINPEGQFYLARLGDAVTGRNLHAALLDALRVGLFVDV